MSHLAALVFLAPSLSSKPECGMHIIWVFFYAYIAGAGIRYIGYQIYWVLDILGIGYIGYQKYQVSGSQSQISSKVIFIYKCLTNQRYVFDFRTFDQSQSNKV